MWLFLWEELKGEDMSGGADEVLENGEKAVWNELGEENSFSGEDGEVAKKLDKEAMTGRAGKKRSPAKMKRWKHGGLENCISSKMLITLPSTCRVSISGRRRFPGVRGEMALESIKVRTLLFTRSPDGH